MSKIRFDLDVPIGPEWSNVELLRNAILNCLAVVFHQHDFSVTVGMVASELVENAIKHGDWSGPDRSQFRCNVDGNGNGVVLRVTNPCPSRAAAEKAISMVKWIQSFPSPDEAYRARLRAVGEETAEGVSGLGLVRIAYEGGCELSATIESDNLLTIEARTRPT